MFLIFIRKGFRSTWGHVTAPVFSASDPPLSGFLQGPQVLVLSASLIIPQGLLQMLSLTPGLLNHKPSSMYWQVTLIRHAGVWGPLLQRWGALASDSKSGIVLDCLPCPSLLDVCTVVRNKDLHVHITACSLASWSLLDLLCWTSQRFVLWPVNFFPSWNFPGVVGTETVSQWTLPPNCSPFACFLGSVSFPMLTKNVTSGEGLWP